MPTSLNLNLQAIREEELQGKRFYILQGVTEGHRTTVYVPCEKFREGKLLEKGKVEGSILSINWNDAGEVTSVRKEVKSAASGIQT